MLAKRAFRDRDRVEVDVLDALVERGTEGITVLELRSHVDADIDEIETALSALKAEDLLVVEDEAGGPLIRPADRAIPDPGLEPDRPSWLEQLRERLPF